MKFEQFKSLYKKYFEDSDSLDISNFTEYESFVDAIYENKEYHDWFLRKKLEREGFNYAGYCCFEMAGHIFDSLDESGNIKQDDPEVVLIKQNNGSYGIPLIDGDHSVIKINYCPWCGSKLNNE